MIFGKFFDRYISDRVDARVKELYQRKTPNLNLIAGYKPLSEIKGAMFEWLAIPFNGSSIMVQVRYCNASQLPQEYDYNQIRIKLKTPQRLSKDDIIHARNAMEALAKVTLNNPTYSSFEKMIYGADNVIAENKKKLAEVEKKLKENENKLDGNAKRNLALEINNLKFWLGYILPEDTMAALTRIALGGDISDIKKITKEKLLNAYWKSKSYSKAPHEFISGIFTDRDAEEIDNAAVYFGMEWEKENKSKMKKASR